MEKFERILNGLWCHRDILKY